MYSNTSQHLANHQRFSRNGLDDELDVELDMLCEKQDECILHINLAQRDSKTYKKLYKPIKTSNNFILNLLNRKNVNNKIISYKP